MAGLPLFFDAGGLPFYQSGSLVTVTTTIGGNTTTTNYLTPATQAAGSVGTDYSQNLGQLYIPNVGASFGVSGPYANYVLIATVPALVAGATRFNVDIENISGGQIVILRDDGTAAEGSAPVNASLIVLAGGGVVGAQGGAWASTTFKGRLQIYAPTAGVPVTIMVD